MVMMVEEMVVVEIHLPVVRVQHLANLVLRKHLVVNLLVEKKLQEHLKLQQQNQLQ
jgi:hypothetical protein